MISDVAGHLFDRLAVAGLQPNLSKGKTEIIIDFRGQGALKARRQLVHDDYHVKTSSQLVTQPLRVVPAYKHLGTWTHVGGRINMDLRVRFAIAHQTVTKFRQQIFANRGMALQTKIQYVGSLVYSALYFHAACWLPQTQREWQCLTKGHFKLHKRLAILHFGPTALTWGAPRILSELGVADAVVFLREARLRFALQLVRNGIPHLWAMIQQDGLWFQALSEDIQWLRSLCPEANMPDHYGDSWDGFASFVAMSAGRWKSIIRRAVKRSIDFDRRSFEWETWHRWALDEIVQMGLQLKHSHLNEKIGFFCIKCQKSFAFKKHGRCNELRKFVCGQQCENCLKHYSTNIDLVNHAKRQPECRNFYLQRGLLVDIAPGVNSRGANAKLGEWHHPFTQAEGPKVPALGHARPIWVEDETSMAEKLRQGWTAACEAEGVMDPLEGLRRATLEAAMFPHEVLALFCQWASEHLQAHEETTLATVCAIERYKMLFGPSWFGIHDAQTDDRPMKATQAFECAAGSFDEIVILPKTLPEFEAIFVAHLFSGHRRDGDLQGVLESMGFKTLSIDIIFDATRGNLLREDTFQFFRKALYMGWVRGFVAGPPCETWSVARGEHGGGPRIVRTAAVPYGHRYLTRKESLQVLLGSGLLGVTVRLLLIAIFCGAVGVMEHPSDDSTDPGVASVWRLAVIRYLLRFRGTRLVRILQGFYGGLSPKPTKLLFTHAPRDLEHILLAARCTPLPCTSAIGRQSDGTWATSKLKEYPKGLCFALAKVFEAALPAKGGIRHPDEFHTFVCDLMADFDTEDFNPATAYIYIPKKRPSFLCGHQAQGC